MKKCIWCNETKIEVMCSGVEVPFICSGRGRSGYADWKKSREMLNRSSNTQLNQDDQPLACIYWGQCSFAVDYLCSPGCIEYIPGKNRQLT
jgi:hypothetical protein